MRALCRIVSAAALIGVASASAAPVSMAPIEITVAQDGSGQFRKVQEAVMSVPAGTFEKVLGGLDSWRPR